MLPETLPPLATRYRRYVSCEGMGSSPFRSTLARMRVLPAFSEGPECPRVARIRVVRSDRKGQRGGLESAIFRPILAGHSGGHVVESEPKKPGRPRAEQTLPLILAQNRPKVVREFTLEAPIAQLIEDYASWAAEASGISSDEARMLLIGRSVDVFTRKDVLYRQHIQDHKGTQQS